MDEQEDRVRWRMTNCGDPRKGAAQRRSEETVHDPDTSVVVISAITQLFIHHSHHSSLNSSPWISMFTRCPINPHNGEELL